MGSYMWAIMRNNHGICMSHVRKGKEIDILSRSSSVAVPRPRRVSCRTLTTKKERDHRLTKCIFKD